MTCDELSYAYGKPSASAVHFMGTAPRKTVQGAGLRSSADLGLLDPTRKTIMFTQYAALLLATLEQVRSVLAIPSLP